MSEPTDPEAPTVDASATDGQTPARVRPRSTQPPVPGLAPGTKVGRYIIERSLGAGGMGVVYVARDPDLDRNVAIKLLHAGAPAERLRREAQALAKLHHPNVVTVFDTGQHEGKSFVAMALVDGKNLRVWQRERRSLRENLRVLLEAGRGLVAAHAAGLMHRDFKPDNVFVSHHGNVLVGDFGLARSADDDPDVSGSGLSAADTGLTMTGTLVGTPAYMPPEQARGEPELASDQFAFCVTAWELLYGERPFAGKNVEEVMDAIEHGRITEPKHDRGVPSRVRRALERGMAARPADRWPSIEALLAELSGESTRRRRNAVLAGAALLAVAGIAWGASRAISKTAPARCRPAEERLAGTWNDARRTEIRDALVKAAPFAATAADNAVRALDRYAGAWKNMWGNTCSTREISDTAFDLEIRCLEQRLGALSATVELLRAPDASSAPNVLDAVERLPEVTTCANLAMLRKVAQAPPELAPRIRELEGRLSRGESLTELGKWNEAIELFSALDKEVAAVGFAPVAAHAALAHALLDRKTQRWPDAKKQLETAIAQANASGDDTVLARAYLELVYTSLRLGDLPRAKELDTVARAVVDRLGDATLRRRLEIIEVEITVFDGKLEAAIAALDRLSASAGAADFKERAALERRRANLLHAVGRVQDAATAYEAALQHMARAVGEGHPQYGAELSARGQFYVLTGRVADGLADWDRAYAIFLATLGPDATSTVETEEQLAAVDVWLGRHEKGIARQRHVVDVRERLSGPEDAANHRSELAHYLLIAGDVAGAEAEVTRALEVARKSPQGPVLVPELERELAMVRLAQGRIEEARTILEASRRAMEKIVAADTDTLDLWWVAQAHVELARGRVDTAIAEASKVTHGIELGEAKLVLAQALAKKGDRAGATTAMDASYAALESLMPGGNARPDLRAQLAKLKASL